MPIMGGFERDLGVEFLWENRTLGQKNGGAKWRSLQTSDYLTNEWNSMIVTPRPPPRQKPRWCSEFACSDASRFSNAFCRTTASGKYPVNSVNREQLISYLEENAKYLSQLVLKFEDEDRHTSWSNNWYLMARKDYLGMWMQGYRGAIHLSLQVSDWPLIRPSAILLFSPENRDTYFQMSLFGSESHLYT